MQYYHIKNIQLISNLPRSCEFDQLRRIGNEFLWADHGIFGSIWNRIDL